MKEGKLLLICVSKEEKNFLYERLGNVLECTRTMVNDSKRHHYWVAETRIVMSLLRDYWDEKISEHYE